MVSGLYSNNLFYRKTGSRSGLVRFSRAQISIFDRVQSSKFELIAPIRFSFTFHRRFIFKLSNLTDPTVVQAIQSISMDRPLCFELTGES